MQTTLPNYRFFNAVYGNPVDRTPIWMMRQAGRYLPEYQKTRKIEPNFMRFCRNPDLVCEVTLQPLKRFPLDAAIIFSDILTIPDAMGHSVAFTPGHGPQINPPLNLGDPLRAQANLIKNLSFVGNGLSTVKKELPPGFPLLGFAATPWTLACYMIQGHSAPGFPKIMEATQTHTKWLLSTLEEITEITIDYLLMQHEHGANAFQLFDSWASLLNAKNYEQFSLQWTARIIESVRSQTQTPVIFFAKNAPVSPVILAQTECQVLSLDAHTSLHKTRQQLPNLTLQGNLDPEILLKAKDVQKETEKMITPHLGNRYIANLGHGILPKTPIESVETFIQTVQSTRQKTGQTL